MKRMKPTALEALLSIRLRMVADNSPLFEIAPGEVMELEDTTLRIDPPSVPFATKRDNLVGFPGMRFQPSLVEAPNARYATTASSWLNNKTSGSMNRATKLAMAGYYCSSLATGFNFAPMIPIQLASRLYALSQGGAQVHEKLSELTKHLRGSVRRNHGKALRLSYNNLWRMLGAFNSEAKVGRLIQEWLQRDVVLGMRPDIMMDGIGVEVKNILESYRGEPTYLERLHQRASQVSREQDACIVVFDLGQYVNFFEHDAMEPFSKVMKHAMWRARRKRVSAILLSHSPFERTPRCLML